MSVVVIATVRPQPEHRAEVVAAFETAIEQVHGEPGCQLYALHESEDRLVMVEKWTDEAALELHRGAPALAELGATLRGKLTQGLDVQVLLPHPAGTETQGAV
jgi:quinol monooxygenase YgiN